MALEIERKFLVKTDFDFSGYPHKRIKQAYLCSVPERSVRVRIKGEQAFLTVKGVGNATELSRYEFEKEIDTEDAEDLLKICEPGMIDKTRYLINYKNHIFELDVFHGLHKGLILCEIELESEDADFDKPEWLGREVTGDKRFYNSNIAKYSYLENEEYYKIKS